MRVEERDNGREIYRVGEIYIGGREREREREWGRHR